MPTYVSRTQISATTIRPSWRVFIAANYPLVSEQEMQLMIREIIGRRKLMRDVASYKMIPTRPGSMKPMDPLRLHARGSQRVQSEAQGF